MIIFNIKYFTINNNHTTSIIITTFLLFIPLHFAKQKTRHQHALKQLPLTFALSPYDVGGSSHAQELNTRSKENCPVDHGYINIGMFLIDLQT